MDVSQAKITDVHRQGGRQNRVGPILVKFEHAEIDPTEFKTLVPTLSLEEDSTGDATLQEQLKLSLRSDHLTYSNRAASVTGLSRPNPYQSTYLCLRNRRTNEMKLYETSTVTVGAKVKPPKSTNLLLNKVEEEEEDKAKSRVTMKKHLVKEFGQAKGQRIYEQADRMQVESSQLESKVNKAAMELNPGALQMPSEVKPPELTPPCNRNAIGVHEVYQLDDILTPEERKHCEEGAEAFQAEYPDNAAIDNGVKIKMFSELFGSLAKRQLRTNNVEYLGAALYMEGMLKLVNMRVRELDKGPRGLTPDNLPHGLKSKIFSTFTENNRLTPESRDRCLCYAIVLGLILSRDYSLEFNAVCSSVKTRADQIKRLVSVIGGSVQSDALTNSSYVILKLPLVTFDTNRISARKKKKTM